jgi:hypothetical protein
VIAARRKLVGGFNHWREVASEIQGATAARLGSASIDTELTAVAVELDLVEQPASSGRHLGI